MGSGKGYKCLKCKYEWVRLSGCGFDAVIYNCDKCGKPEAFKLSQSSQQPVPCECGGKFYNHNIVICPNCQSTEVKHDGQNILWD
jgi:DNA-directed RNA polymerase subunit RPC12/RpoP